MTPPPIRWPLVAGLAGVAALAGFGAARWTAPSPPPPALPPAAAAADDVRIPATYLAAADIAVEPVVAGDVQAEVIAPAAVAALPGSEAVIVARVSGMVTRILRRLGDPVRAGEPVALVDSLDASAMTADRSVAAAKAGLARKTFDREAALYRQGVTPRQDMEAARAALDVAEAEAHRATAVARAAHVGGDGGSVAVVSPIGGRITAQSVTVGAFVQPQSELLHVARPGPVLVEAAVPAADARRVAAGDAARIITGTGVPIAAVVRSVTPSVNGASQAATVVVTPRADTRALAVGEGVEVRIRVRGGGGLSVPEDAVQTLDGRDVLFVRTPQGFHARPVRIGTRSGGLAQILSGVAPGERVATRNAFLVKGEMTKGGGE